MYSCAEKLSANILASRNRISLASRPDSESHISLFWLSISVFVKGWEDGPGAALHPSLQKFNEVQLGPGNAVIPGTDSSVRYLSSGIWDGRPSASRRRIALDTTQPPRSRSRQQESGFDSGLSEVRP